MNTDIERLLDYIYEDDYASFMELLPTVDAGLITDYEIDAGNILFWAVSERKVPFIEALLKWKVNPNKIFTDRTSVLPIAVFWDVGAEIIALLLAYNADPNIGVGGDGDDALTLAVLGNNLQNVKLLVEKGANVNSDNNGHITPLIQACLMQNTAIVDYLLKNRADPNQGADGTNCFEMAHGNADIIALLKAGGYTA
jgi:ankyrin repeat protein